MEPLFNKDNGLIPVIIQHYLTGKVLMLGYMNREAYQKTSAERKVTFYSRSKKRLWTKGENSGNFLIVKEMTLDCDRDTFLIKVDPSGPACHRNTESCFDDISAKGFVYQLEAIITERLMNPGKHSYTSCLVKQGINKILQKVGEEAVELIIDSQGENKERILEESADLFYHFLLLLKVKGIDFSELEQVLKKRNGESASKEL